MLQQSKNQEFNSGWPRYTRQDGAAIEYEISLSPRGEIPSGTVIRAWIDDSEQYRADGRCWRALTPCRMIAVGQRIEHQDVLGWRAVRR